MGTPRTRSCKASVVFSAAPSMTREWNAIKPPINQCMATPTTLSFLAQTTQKQPEKFFGLSHFS